MALAQNGFTTQQLNTAVSEITSEEITADIISLVRRYAIGSPLVSHQARIRRAVDKLKKAHNFSRVELNWLSRIESYLLNESVMNVKVLMKMNALKQTVAIKGLTKSSVITSKALLPNLTNIFMTMEAEQLEYAGNCCQTLELMQRIKG